MKIYNTQSKKKEEFVPRDGKNVNMYVCGPTVYDRAHIGNLRAYINADLLRRTLSYLDYSVKHVMNITDIEDKIIKTSIEQKKDYKEITDKFEKLFFEDLEKLNIEKPEITPHATDDDVIKKIIDIIESLIDKDFAYVSDDGSIYFSVDKFPSYGKLSHLDKEGIKPGVRCSIDEYEKDNIQDFALWKKYKEGEPSWEGPQGIKGRPGWHIECSAMSMMNLGETIDIHTGGVDNIFPHHENEIAQSEAYTGKTFVNYWFHGEHLLINNGKMSKSLGNIYSIDDLREVFNEYIDPLAFRLLNIQSHYRDRLNLTKESIIAAQRTYEGLRNFITELNTFNSRENSGNIGKYISIYMKDFSESISNDLNIPMALASLFDFIKKIRNEKNISKTDSNKIKEAIFKTDNVFGLGLNKIMASVAWVTPKNDIKTKAITKDNEVDKLYFEYRKAKYIKNYELSDELRDKKISSLGYYIEENKDNYIIKKK